MSWQEVVKVNNANIDENDQPTSEPHDPPMWIQVDGEPCLMTPPIIQFVSDQKTVRGGPSIPNESQ